MTPVEEARHWLKQWDKRCAPDPVNFALFRTLEALVCIAEERSGREGKTTAGGAAIAVQSDTDMGKSEAHPEKAVAPAHPSDGMLDWEIARGACAVGEWENLSPLRHELMIRAVRAGRAFERSQAECATCGGSGRKGKRGTKEYGWTCPACSGSGLCQHIPNDRCPKCGGAGTYVEKVSHHAGCASESAHPCDCDRRLA
jgi:hypothetical protein